MDRWAISDIIKHFSFLLLILLVHKANSQRGFTIESVSSERNEEKKLELLLELSDQDHFYPKSDKSPNKLLYNPKLLALYDLMSENASQILSYQDNYRFRYYHFSITYAQHHYKSAIAIGEQMIRQDYFSTPLQKFKVYYWLAHSYRNLGMHSRFLEIIQTLSELPVSEGKFFNRYEHCDAVAISYYKINQFNDALYYFRKAQNVLPPYDRKHVTILNNMGLCHSHNLCYDSAAVYLENALVKNQMILDSMPNNNIWLHMDAVIKSNIARKEFILKNIPREQLISVLKKEVKAAIKYNDYRSIYGAMTAVAEEYYFIGKIDSSLHYLKKRIAYQKHKISSKTFLKGLDLESKIALLKDKKAEADSIDQRMEEIRDSVNQFRNQPRTELSALANKNKENLREIDLKSNQIRESEQQIAFERQRRFYLTITIALFVVIVILLFFFLRRMRKQKNELSAKNELVESTLEQRETLLKEIHHRVKNNLQVISGLMQSQGIRSNDPLVKEIMKSGQDRVKSMALIHEKLYQTQDFTNIQAQDYILDLVSTIEQGYLLNRSNISLNVQIEDVHFDIDTAIPLGLIINELLTNAYKYAFVDNQEGLIHLELRKHKKHICFFVSDNGRGLPKEFDFEQTRSLGLTLVKGLSRQLNGEAVILPSENGLKIEIRFPMKNNAHV